MKWIYEIFCKHDWKLLSETITKSKFEHSIETLRNDTILNHPTDLPWQLCNADRKYIQIFQCSKCKKLKKFVEKI